MLESTCASVPNALLYLWLLAFSRTGATVATMCSDCVLYWFGRMQKLYGTLQSQKSHCCADFFGYLSSACWNQIW